MKTTSYIAIITALAVVTTPLTATARSHRHSTGAALTGLAVGLGIGMLSSASVQAQPVYRYETTPVYVQQPVPVYYSPPPVYYAPPPVYAPPAYYPQQVIIHPRPTYNVIHSYPTHYPSSHRGTRGAPYYRPSPSSHRGTHSSYRGAGYPHSSHRGHGRR